MTNAEIARWRLASQRIAGPKFADPTAAVHHLGAMQAQAYGQSLWAIGLRTKGATVVRIEQAIADRKIVQTWPMRGTIHFVPAEDAKWMLRLSASRMLARARRRHEQLGLDEAIFEHSTQIMHDALHGGRQLLRTSVMTLVVESGISTTQQRGYHILWNAAQSGLICMGPIQGNEQTFVLLDEWVPGSRELSREDSLAELATRYFTGHGPATVQDFAWWAGLTITDARAGLEAAKTGLVSEQWNGKQYWMPPGSAVPGAAARGDVFLLPGFDEYLLGYQDRSAVLRADQATRIVPGSNGVFLPTIVAEGQVVGTWNRELNKTSVEIRLSPFAYRADWEARIIEDANDYGDFVGMPVTVTVETPSASSARGDADAGLAPS